MFLDCIARFIRLSVEDSLADQIPTEHWEVHASLLAAYMPMPFATQVLVELGKKLLKEKKVDAAHICFLLAGELPRAVDDPKALFCILGADHHDSDSFARLVDPRNIVRTEILEFAVRLNNPEIDCLPGLQTFKFVLAQKLAEAGEEKQAAKYVQFINAFVRALPASQCSAEFKTRLRDFDQYLEVRPGHSSAKAAPRPTRGWFSLLTPNS